MTAASGNESGGDVTEDFNTSNSPLGSELSENGHLIRNIDEGTQYFYFLAAHAFFFFKKPNKNKNINFQYFPTDYVI